MPPLQCDFFDNVYFFLWTSIFSTYLYQLTFEKNQVYTLWQFDTLQANPKTDEILFDQKNEEQ